jgi:hypothetical protein
MEDKTKTCESCGQQFTLTAGELEFYKGRGIEEPVICKDCRRELRDEGSEVRGEGEGGGVGGPFNI